MLPAAAEAGISLPDRELACAPIRSDVGQRYLGAMRAAVNCALANRQILGHYARHVFGHFFPHADLELLFDVSHNTCKAESHRIDGRSRDLFVHRKGATRAFGPGHPSLPAALREVGRPVLIGGSMGTGSYVLVGAATSEEKAFASPATALAGHSRGMQRSSAGGDARWSTSWRRRASWCEARRCAASRRKRRPPIKMCPRSSWQPSDQASPAAWRVCGR
jgi:tRNA-splicing ligase RtcB (3'-phosphate/5'-hydroxy nucleic acid ligase)